MSILSDRYVIRVVYHDDVYDALYNNKPDSGRLVALKSRVGYVCAVNQSYTHADSAFRPEASVALYTKQGAERVKKALVKNWKQYVSQYANGSNRWGHAYSTLKPGLAVDDQIPKIDVVKVNLTDPNGDTL